MMPSLKLGLQMTENWTRVICQYDLRSYGIKLENYKHRRSKKFLISTPSWDLFILANSESPEIKVNQILFSKLTLGMFGLHAFDYNIDQQLNSEDAL